MQGAPIRARIEEIAAGGAGLARVGGKSVFVEGSAPGETVICRITEERRSWALAELLEVADASPERVRPACAFYGACGGCSLQHLSYPAQLAAKTAILKSAFARIGGFSPPEPAVLPSEPWEYRNRMQFHAVRQTGRRSPGALFGLKARKSSEIVPVSDCPVADPGIRSLLGSRQASAPGSLFVSPAKDRVAVYARRGLLLSESGPSRGKTRILGKDLALDAGVFFQSNGAMLERLAADLREIAARLAGADRGPRAADLAPGELADEEAPLAGMPMADLYCGVGTFAAFLGEFFPRADLVEESRPALALARENLARLGSASFFAGRIEDWAKTADLRGYGLAVADPPRQGLAQGLARRLAQSGPAALAYVSCDPATLARDSKALLASYELAQLRLYDFYPQTAHIEALALFVRRGQPARH